MQMKKGIHPGPILWPNRVASRKTLLNRATPPIAPRKTPPKKTAPQRVPRPTSPPCRRGVSLKKPRPTACDASSDSQSEEERSDPGDPVWDESEGRGGSSRRRSAPRKTATSSEDSGSDPEPLPRPAPRRAAQPAPMAIFVDDASRAGVQGRKKTLSKSAKNKLSGCTQRPVVLWPFSMSDGVSRAQAYAAVEAAYGPEASH